MVATGTQVRATSAERVRRRRRYLLRTTPAAAVYNVHGTCCDLLHVQRNHEKQRCLRTPALPTGSTCRLVLVRRIAPALSSIEEALMTGAKRRHADVGIGVHTLRACQLQGGEVEAYAGVDDFAAASRSVVCVCSIMHAFILRCICCIGRWPCDMHVHQARESPRLAAGDVAAEWEFIMRVCIGVCTMCTLRSRQALGHAGESGGRFLTVPMPVRMTNPAPQGAITAPVHRLTRATTDTRETFSHQ